MLSKQREKDSREFWKNVRSKGKLSGFLRRKPWRKGRLPRPRKGKENGYWKKIDTPKKDWEAG